MTKFKVTLASINVAFNPETGEQRAFLTFTETSGKRHSLGIGLSDPTQRQIGERELSNAYPDLKSSSEDIIVQVLMKQEELSKIAIDAYLEEQDKINPNTGKKYTNLRLCPQVKNMTKEEALRILMGASLPKEPTKETTKAPAKSKKAKVEEDDMSK